MARRLFAVVLLFFQFSSHGLTSGSTEVQPVTRIERHIPSFNGGSVPGHNANETRLRKYVLKFWNSFKQLKLNEIEDYYQEDVVQLRYSILRHPKLGIDTDTSGISTFSKRQVLTAISRLKRFAPIQSWIHFFNNKYKVDITHIELTTVEKSDPNIRTYVQRNLNIFQLFLKPQFFIEGIKHRFTIHSKDFIFVVRQKPKKVLESLIFVFDKDTHKIKAQTLMIGVPPSAPPAPDVNGHEKLNH